MSKKVKGEGEFVTEAYNLEDEQSMKEFYAKWAEEYDNQMTVELDYLSPTGIAKSLIHHMANKQANILDIGCGTGLTVKTLFESGYDQLYGIDLSEEMVNVAKSRNYYVDLQVGDVNQPLIYKSDFFDGVISSGTFTHGHVGPEPLDEICRILKTDGILACTIHDELYQSLGFKDKFDQLIANKTLECLSLTMESYFAGKEPEGWFCVYKKL